MSDVMDIFGDLFDEYKGPIAPTVKKSPVYVETCDGCRGTGQFRGYSGRVVGQCFKCKGTGKREFKLSAAQRQYGRDQAAKRRQQQAATKAEKAAAWREEYPGEAKWIDQNAGRFEFATAMAEALVKWGGLTEGQLGGVRKCIQRNEERNAQRQAESVARAAAAPTVSIAAIETAFQSALGNGIKRPKMRLAGFKLSLAPATGANAGAVYIKVGDEYLGKVKDGRFFRSYTCTTETEAEIVEVCSDPMNAAIAYGRRTGSCAICARELTKGESIERGIGPICAEKYGW